MNLKIKKSALLLGIFMGFFSGCKVAPDNDNPIRPSAEYPGYWEYKGTPVLLIGGTDTDNLFQKPFAISQLHDLSAAGGNYVRNTMSARGREDVQPFLELENRLYDLNQWNPEYWHKLDTMLQTAQALDVIVQIEVWDRFDFSRDSWGVNAFNPALNVNYTTEESGLDSVYANHPGADEQPFFHTISGMPRYTSNLDLVRSYQEKYVAKLVEHTYQYPNVLYAMNNETNSPVEWGQHWIQFMRNIANKKNVEVYLTDMFDAFYKPTYCTHCQTSIARTDIYDFIEISQINSQFFGQTQWDTLMLIMDLVKDVKRPANCTKVYGGGESFWGSGTNQDGVERFCRILVGGVSSARFHRPYLGNGLNDLAKAAFAAVRDVEKHIPFWEVDPANDLLSNRDENEAYLASNGNDKFLVYFPAGGSVDVSIGHGSHTLDIQWIGVAPGQKRYTIAMEAQDRLTLETPDDKGWFAVIKL